MRGLALALVTAGLLAIAAAFPASGAAKACGAGNINNAKDIKANGVGCKLARKVVKASNAKGCGQGACQPFTKGEISWKCGPTPKAYHNKCTGKKDGDPVSVKWVFVGEH
jgi:hypothetical protein